MKPYWQSPDAALTLYLGDARDVLPAIPAASCDLLLTDPPYGVSWQGMRRTTGPMFPVLAGDDGTLDVVGILAEACRRLRRGRHVYVFGPFDLSPLDIASPAELIWDKDMVGLGDLEVPWGPSHEPIQFGVYQFSKANREQGYGRLTARMRRGSVIRCRRLVSGQVNRHPTEKPVLLLRQLIESSSVIGETVLDPFVGCGSTLEACAVEGRYAEAAATRLQQQALPLFDVPAPQDGSPSEPGSLEWLQDAAAGR